MNNAETVFTASARDSTRRVTRLFYMEQMKVHERTLLRVMAEFRCLPFNATFIYCVRSVDIETG
jgi:hypothetical protein